MGIWFSSGAKAQTSASCGVPGCDTNLLTALLPSLTRVPELPSGASPVGERSPDAHEDAKQIVSVLGPEGLSLAVQHSSRVALETVTLERVGATWRGHLFILSVFTSPRCSSMVVVWPLQLPSLSLV